MRLVLRGASLVAISHSRPPPARRDDKVMDVAVGQAQHAALLKVAGESGSASSSTSKKTETCAQKFGVGSSSQSPIPHHGTSACGLHRTTTLHFILADRTQSYLVAKTGRKELI